MTKNCSQCQHIRHEKDESAFKCVTRTYHLLPGQPVSLLLDAGLGALAANGQRLHHEAVLHGQVQLPGGLLGVHAEHAAQVPRQAEVEK